MNHSKHHHPLNAALWIIALFAIIELIGGFVSGSLALIADAGHMASDVIALGLASLARYIAQRPAHTGMTYGYGRAKVLAAQVNGLGLWFLSGWITWEAIGRLGNPPMVQGNIVLVIAFIGLMINLIVMHWMQHGGGHEHDINMRAAYWHIVGDALGSVAAIIAGLVIIWTGWMLIDPILSFLVAGILTWGGWSLLRETTLELMEAVPENVDSTAITEAMQLVEGVNTVHHIHIWRLPAGHMALSAHVQTHELHQWPMVLADLHITLKQHGIDHATLQPELKLSQKEQQCCSLKDEGA